VGERDRGSDDDEDQLAALEPSHVNGFNAFVRAGNAADRAVAADPDVASRLSPDLNPALGRRVYAGELGRIYIVPGRGSLCYVAIDATGEMVMGHTSTELAVRHGLGHFGSRANHPVRFVGVLPSGAQALRIIDRAGLENRVTLTPDDAYWISVRDPVEMVWTASDGVDQHVPIGRPRSD
jgi:hypothetical protein